MSTSYIHGSAILSDPSEDSFFNIISVKDIRFTVGGVSAFDITSSGASLPTSTITDLTVTNDLTVNNNLTVDVDATVDGDFILGGDMTITGNIITGISTTIDGRDVATDGTNQDAHIADGTIHYTQANITQTGALTSGSINWSGNIQTSGDVICDNLTVNGTTATINSEIVTIDDPIFQLGGDVAPIADDNKDRGIGFRWHNGTSAKNGFFGFNDSNGKFTFIPDATNIGEVISGAVGDIEVGSVDVTGNIVVSGTVDGRDIATDGTNQDTHIASTSNPHSVTKAQVGLSNVENTALSTWSGSSNITTLGTITSGNINTSGFISCLGDITTVSGTVDWSNGELSATSLNEPIFKYRGLGSVNNDYALKQNISGKTFLNSSSGQNISFGVNNSEVAYLDGTGVMYLTGISSTGTATAGGFSTGGNVSCDDLIMTGNITEQTKITDNRQSTSTTSGALIVDGGVGIDKNINVGGDVSGDGDFNISSGDMVVGADGETSGEQFIRMWADVGKDVSIQFSTEEHSTPYRQEIRYTPATTISDQTAMYFNNYNNSATATSSVANYRDTGNWFWDNSVNDCTLQVGDLFTETMYSTSYPQIKENISGQTAIFCGQEIDQSVTSSSSFAPAEHKANIWVSASSDHSTAGTMAGSIAFANENQFGGYNVCYARISGRRTGNFHGGFDIEVMPSGSGTLQQAMQIDGNKKIWARGDLAVTGTLSKGAGSFRIEHPLECKKDTHDLVHSFVEAPKADLIYRGRNNLINGSVDINIDNVAGMTEGTFQALCKDVQCFVTNEEGWTMVRGSVTGNILTIVSQTPCNDKCSWLVIGERKDETFKNCSLTDDNGNMIIEPEKYNEDAYNEMLNNQCVEECNCNGSP